MPPIIQPVWSPELRALISAKGGELDLARFPHEHQSFIEAAVSLADRWLSPWQGGSGRIWTRFDWAFTNGKSCDAFAHFDGTMHFIGLHAGLILRLADLLETVLADKAFMDLVGSPTPKGLDWKEVGRGLLDDTVCWVTMHEIAHVIRGHVFHLRTAGLGTTLNEAREDGGIEQPESDLVRQFEVDADLVGIDFAMRLVGSVKVK